MRSLKLILGLGLTGSLLISIHCAAGDKIYKWVDDKGMAHYATHPPKGVKSDKITTQTGHSEPNDYQKAAIAPKDKEQSAESTASVDDTKASTERCAQAKNNLTALQNNARVRLKEADGSLRFLSQEEHSERMQKAQAILDKEC